MFPPGTISMQWSGEGHSCPCLVLWMQGCKQWSQRHETRCLIAPWFTLARRLPRLQFSVRKMHLNFIMSSFSLQAAWCVGCCLLSKSFWDICSCSACSDFAGTKIITQRTEKKKYVCVHMYMCIQKREKKIEVHHRTVLWFKAIS